MIEYRAFRNTDPPHLVDIWNQQVPLPGLMQPMTMELLDAQVLAKPFFDRHGLIVAVQDQRPIGFVHAAFGPTADGSQLDYSAGLICLLMVRPNVAQTSIPRELIVRAEAYLHRKGAVVIQGGTTSPRAPFYEGLYGGAICPGVLAEDRVMIDALVATGYHTTERHAISRGQVAEVRPIVDRNTMLVRRSCQVQAMIDPPSTSWWQACTDAWQQRFRFTARARADGREMAHVTFRNASAANPLHGMTVGLSQLQLFDTENREGIVLFLLGEAIRQLRSEGIDAVEATIGPGRQTLGEALARLHFRVIGHGLIFQPD